MAKKRRIGKSYEGVLLQPISQKGWRGSTLFDDATGFERTQIYKDQILERFLALTAHYQIFPHDDRMWAKLAIALATQHVPGFQVRKVSRKKDLWTKSKLAQLRYLVGFERRHLKNGTRRAELLDASTAISNLFKRKPRPPLIAKLSPGTVRKRYGEARKARERHLTFLLTPWHGAMYRTPNFRSPYWRGRLERGDPEALRLKAAHDARVRTLADALGEPNERIEVGGNDPRTSAE